MRAKRSEATHKPSTQSSHAAEPSQAKSNCVRAVASRQSERSEAKHMPYWTSLTRHGAEVYRKKEGSSLHAAAI